MMAGIGASRKIKLGNAITTNHLLATLAPLLAPVKFVSPETGLNNYPPAA
jgi:hypothetical protein